MLDPRDEIKQKTDIVELIGEYLTLKPAGTHGFRVLCPFHSEKTPSFHVSSDRQIWHCFGCGEGGDCFSFVMKMEGMDFPEALLHLGQKAGVEVRRVASTQGNLKQRLQEINDLSARFYHKILIDSQIAQSAREYIIGRGITSNLIEKFQIGYSPDEWNYLTQFLLKRGFSETEIVSAGLGQKKRNNTGLIDRFRDRLMIPLRDHHGHTVGFTARLIPISNFQFPISNFPKYINSPETPIYHKSSLLFGLDLAKTSVKQKNCAIVVEGNLDVVGSHKAGVENIVASSGTALTEDQLRLLGRYTKTLIFCFDQDAAGFAAVKRGIPVARSLGFDVRTIILPTGAKDPDELVQNNPEFWQKLSSTSVPIMQYLIDRVTTGKDLKNVDDKRIVSQELLPALADIKDIVEQEHWLKVVANTLGIDESILRSHIQNSKLQNPKPRTQNPELKTQNSKRSKEEQATMMIFGLFISDPKNYVEIVKGIRFSENNLFTLAELYKKAIEIYNTLNLAQQKSFFLRLENHFRSESREDLIKLLIESLLLSEKSFSHLPPQDVQKQLNTLISLLNQSFEQSRRKAIAVELRQAEQAGDQEAIKRLLLKL